MKCPICNGKLMESRISYSFKGIYFGDFDALVCSKCNESFIREKHLESIENFARRMGVWGSGVIPHIDISTTNTNYLLLVRFSQLFNRYEPVPYSVASVK
jgi:YgiT-type zinc finger domain-containing protein